MLGALDLALLVDLVRDVARTGSADLFVLGPSARLSSPEELVPVATALGLAVGVALIGGVALLRASRRRRREEEAGGIRRLQTMRRLLEERERMLSASVRELERRQEALRSGATAPLEEPGGVPGPEPGPIVVLPEAPVDRT